MTKPKAKLPKYAKKAIDSKVWLNPPCVSGYWDEFSTCPANKEECPHAEVTKGYCNSSYWTRCNARPETLRLISLYKKYSEKEK